VADNDAEIERLARALEQERAARRESEQAADEALRALFDRRRDVELLVTVASAANAGREPEVALAQVLAAVCAHTAWPVGHAFTVAGGKLIPTGVWALSDPDRYEAFREQTAATEFAPGEGLPGRALATGEPVLVGDIASTPWFVRGQTAQEGGLCSAFAFPLLASDEVVGVLEFFSAEQGEPDRVLMALMSHVGTQAGRVVERAHAREDLERSNADLEQFAYRISHDLQEPLRTVTAFADLLERRHADALAGDAKEFLDFVTDGARRMQRMVGGLLEFSRAGRFEVSDERADTGAIARQALAALAARVEETSAQVEIADDLPEVRGSNAGLGQVFQNLLDNALKFTPEGEPPRVLVAVREAPGEWEFAVADAGIGVDATHRERIFDVFERLHTREAYEGSGVGLAVTRRILERHGGRIWVEDNEPQGAVFRFTLPR
jgi:signal transduction histidine kinase